MTDPAEPKPNPVALIAKALARVDETEASVGRLSALRDDFITAVRQILAEHGEGE